MPGIFTDVMSNIGQGLQTQINLREREHERAEMDRRAGLAQRKQLFDELVANRRFEAEQERAEQELSLKKSAENRAKLNSLISLTDSVEDVNVLNSVIEKNYSDVLPGVRLKAKDENTATIEDAFGNPYLFDKRSYFEARKKDPNTEPTAFIHALTTVQKGEAPQKPEITETKARERISEIEIFIANLRAGKGLNQSQQTMLLLMPGGEEKLKAMKEGNIGPAISSLQEEEDFLRRKFGEVPTRPIVPNPAFEEIFAP